ncbi:MAG TPA: ribokinase [Verrucomicrobia bacterium]|nr:ribokinase [Verrucomicrobiota bacterium]
MKKIVVLGSTNTDMVITGRKIPVPGETVCDGTFLMNPGGKGANQAVAVARLAAEPDACVFIAKVGNDLFGRETAVRLRKDGIDARLITDPSEASGVALILVDERGQNVISVALGANGTLSEADILPYKEEVENAAALLMQLETPIPTVLAAAKWAHGAGVPVILNPAPAAELPPELLACVDWITPNETETELLTGVAVTDGASAAKAADALKARGVKHVLVTRGAQGCWCEGVVYPCAPVKAVDCVAAGDTFNGAFVVALTEGKTAAEAVAFAQNAAGIAVTRPGAQASVPFRREVPV